MRSWSDSLPRFAVRPEALDAERYLRFEAFVAASGLIEGTPNVPELAIELGAQ